MNFERPGHQYRRNKDGTVVHYWNPARVSKGIAASLPPIVRFRADIGHDEMARECQRLTSELRAGRTYVDVVQRKRQNISEHLFKMYRKRAGEIGKPFSLTETWIYEALIDGGDKCAISGVPFNYDPQPRGIKSHFKHPLRPSLDRIDNKDGYVSDNIRVVLHCVNIGINEWGLDNYIAVCKAVASYEHTDGKLLDASDW